MPLDTSNPSTMAASAASAATAGMPVAGIGNLGGMTPTALPGGDASQLYAQVTQQQWSSYMQNFVPYENQLISYAMDPNKVATNMGTAGSNVAAAFGQQAGMQQRRLAQYGIGLNPDEQKAQQRDLALNKSVADVQARNQAKDITVANQMSIIGAPMTGVVGGAPTTGA
jgi:hypothetical protein